MQALSQLNDVDGDHWAAPYIGVLSRQGVFEGYTDGSFKPEQGITREEIAVTLVRALGLEQRLESEFEENFEDNTDIADWSKKSVYLLTQMGIFTGYDDGLFRPRDIITREELAVVIARALTKTGVLLNLPFGDNQDIGNWASEWIRKAFSLGIIKGYDDKTFRPLNSITRAEVATILYNFMYVENLLN
ncbi:MAG: S-layer homology domain-containing protein [Clostridiaceae bacterium]|nr:S-layer homology domain-containing protein [Clostridiaceae bacterium]